MSYRRLRQTRYGNPADVLFIETLADPTPGSQQVVIRMEAAALHIADLYYVGAHHGFVGPLPRTPGFEGVGRITSVGSGVDKWSVGDRVFAPLGSGTCAELVVAPAAQLIGAPEGDREQLALMMVNGATAVALVEDFAALKAGDWLLQNAANSNCGRFVITLARRKGIRTCNLVRRAELIDELQQLGGDVVMLDGDDLPQRVADATADADLMLALDAVAGSATGRLAQCLADGGRVVNYGAVTRKPCEISFYTMFRKDVTLVGMSMGKQMQKRDAAQRRAVYEHLAGLIAAGELTAAIAGTYTLDEYPAAFAQAAETGTARPGKVIVLPND
jgi:NADPH:quinone reductase-like Zn-dependent oxidoreductase